MWVLDMAYRNCNHHLLYHLGLLTVVSVNDIASIMCIRPIWVVVFVLCSVSILLL